MTDFRETVSAAGRRDFRETVSAALDALAEDDLKELLTGIFSVERLTTAVCPECGERVNLRSPDYKGYASALAQLDGIGKGRPRDPAPPGEIDDSELEARMRAIYEKNPDLHALALADEQ